MSPETDPSTPSGHERRASEYLALTVHALLERFPDAAHLHFTAVEDGKFVTVGELSDAQGTVLHEAPGTIEVDLGPAADDLGEEPNVMLSVEGLFIRGLLLYPWPVSALTGVVLEDPKQGLYRWDLAGL